MMIAGVMYQHNAYRTLMLCIMLVNGFLLATHKLPGFDNPQILDQVYISQQSAVYSMYLNIDKFIAGIIIFWSVFNNEERKCFHSGRSFHSLAIILPLIIISMIIANYTLIDYDPKLSEYLLIFSIHNLLFTCIAEEAYFRGLIQKQLAIRGFRYLIPVGISAVLFGAAHSGTAQLDYLVAATIAGFAYAYAYEKTGSVSISILLHWLLNLVHFSFFTYPFVR